MDKAADIIKNFVLLCKIGKLYYGKKVTRSKRKRY